MVRKKPCPCRSLKEVDYNHPSLVFWFFTTEQQAPLPQSKGKSKIENISKDKEKKSKRPKHSKGDDLSADQLQNDYISDGSTQSERFLPQKSALIKDEGSNDADFQEFQLASNKNKVIDVKPTGLAISQPSTVHPLSSHPDVPPLTDLQIYITEAILNEGDSCPFEKIYEYVSKRWKNIKRRDGSNYATDCRRAIQANLRHSPHHIALFKKDKSKPGGNFWQICKTIEDAMEVSREIQAEKKGKSREKLSDAEPNSEDMIIDESSQDKTSNLETPNKNSGIIGSPLVSKSGSSEKKLSDLQVMICECINDNGGSCHFDLIVHHVSKNWNKIKGTNQDCKSAILAALTDSKRFFKRDTKRTGWWMISDPEVVKNLVNTSLISPSSPSQPVIKEESMWRSLRNKQRKAGKGLESPNTPDDSSAQEKNSEEIKNEEGNVIIDENFFQRKDAPSDLQILIINAIHSSPGGWGTFDQIHEEVAKSFDNVKRRDGAPYASDCKKAIQATLSNNPTTRPFFKKEVKRGVTMWGLAKRSLDFIGDWRRLYGENTLPQPTATRSQFFIANKPNLNNISDLGDSIINPDGDQEEEEDEEIKDEDIDINDDFIPNISTPNEKIETNTSIESQDTSDSESQVNQKEPKQSYANRLKRARKLQEKSVSPSTSAETSSPNNNMISNINLNALSNLSNKRQRELMELNAIAEDLMRSESPSSPSRNGSNEKDSRARKRRK